MLLAVATARIFGKSSVPLSSTITSQETRWRRCTHLIDLYSQVAVAYCSIAALLCILLTERVLLGLKTNEEMRVAKGRRFEALFYPGFRRQERLRSKKIHFGASSAALCAAALCLLATCWLFELIAMENVEKSVSPTNKMKQPPILLHSNHVDVDSATFRQRMISDETTTSCDGKDGIMVIKEGGAGAAFGAVFFRWILVQLQYAEKHNLVPVIHLNNFSQKVFDANAAMLSFEGMVQHPALNLVGNWEDHFMNSSSSTTSLGVKARDCLLNWKPGPPQGHSNITTLQLNGNGLWQLYFAPVPRLPLDPKSCNNKILVSLTRNEIGDELLSCVETVRHFRYKGMSLKKQQLHLRFDEWVKPYRVAGQEMVKKGYYEIQPTIQEKFSKRMPGWLVSQSRKPHHQRSCLAMHIRHSDKGAGRKLIELAQFLPFVKVYLEQCLLRSSRDHDKQKCQVFLATDSTKVITEIQKDWPSHVVERVNFQGNILRSSNRTAVFNMVGTAAEGMGHHRTNTEILLDIMGLSSCVWMLHGHSAVSESALYLNEHLESVNLEEDDHISSEVFGKRVIAWNDVTNKR